MKALFIFAVVLGAAFGRVAEAESLSPFETRTVPDVSLAASRTIDSLVFDNLRKLKIEPAKPCSDPVFLRRVFLDTIGTLPTAAEAKAFLEDKASNKRTALIDRLLERDEFADYWGMKWCDLLRVKSEFPVNLWPNAAQAYDRWIRNALKQNMAYSRFAWELLTANGSNFRAPTVNFYRSAGSRDPKALARIVALTFMGERADKWPPKKLADMAAFFSSIGFKPTGEWKEEIIYFDGIDGTHGFKGDAALPDGTVVRISPDKDPREQFALWLTTSKSSPLARSAVNRIWFWLMGRGIVQEPDDFRPDNPPSNPELLDTLAREFVETTYDMKRLFRTILNTHTYQLSCIPATTGTAAERNFAYYPLRRLDAEVLVDALNQITGGTEEYSSMIPEPFTWVPVDTRTMALPDGSISSSFLEMFGRPPRDTGFLSERNNKPTSAQRLHLLNSSHIQEKIVKSAKLRELLGSEISPEEAATRIYLTILSRYPTDQELRTVSEFRDSAERNGIQRSQIPADLIWALLNNTEFLFRH